MHLIKNIFLSPYFIFIKEGFKISDQELLQNLGLEAYEWIADKKEKQKEFKHEQCLCLTEDGHWTHLMDDWYYNLWHKKELKAEIKKLSRQFDIFSCYIGDCDESFGFSYYESGELVREYIVEDPNFKGRKVAKDFGKPFPNEAAIFKSYDILEQIVLMAKLVGIDIEHRLEDIRCYRKLEEVPETFIFEESEY